MRFTSRTQRAVAIVLAAGLLVLAAGTAATSAAPRHTSQPVPSIAMETHDGVGPQFYSGATVDIRIAPRSLTVAR